MRLHTSACKGKIYEAAAASGVDLLRVEHHGSRSHLQAFDVILSGSNSRYINSPHFDTHHSATWDEWGMFLNYVYIFDNAMKAGDAYHDRHDFNWQTCNRFLTLRPSGQHRQHNWYYVAWADAHYCDYCPARRRRRL